MLLFFSTFNFTGLDRGISGGDWDLEATQRIGFTYVECAIGVSWIKWDIHLEASGNWNVNGELFREVFCHNGELGT